MRSNVLLFIIALLSGACSEDPRATDAGAGAGASGGAGGEDGLFGTTSTGTGGPVTCDDDPTADGDGDGWTEAEGDCNDCEANANPGAIEVVATDDGAPMVDEDCDGAVDEAEPACDTGLALDDQDPMNGARAIELCQEATDGKWGVIEASYERSHGAPVEPGPVVGLLDAFGDNVSTQRGERMLVLSSGRARTPGMPDACPTFSCLQSGMGLAPPLFPQNVPGCDGGVEIHDDIAFRVKLRAPTNATGYAFSFKFYSFEFPYYVCSEYNDQFIAHVTPAPPGAIHGNICFDSSSNPVSVNIAFFDVCDPNNDVEFAGWCKMTSLGCPNKPTPYCPSGPAELAATGFEWQGFGGATSWLKTTAPVAGGEELTIRFIIWDTGDPNLDSSALLDGFEWLAEGGTVVGTAPVAPPR